MKIKTKILMALFAFALTLSTLLGGIATVYAATVTGTNNTDVEIVAERSSDEIIVTFRAKSELDFGGLGFFYNFDDKTEYVSYTPGTVFDGAKQANLEKRKIGLSGTGLAKAAQGDTLVSFVYSIPEGFKKNQDYKFSLKMDMVFHSGAAQEDYTWTDALFEVIYREDEYTITYDLADGTLEEGVTNPETYDEESEDITLNKPTKGGYEFAGWTGTDLDEASTDVTIPTGSKGNREYKATWNPIEYTITYDLDGGNLEEGTSNPDKYTVENDPITLSNPTKTGYTFAGWKGTGLDDATDTVSIPTGSTGDRTYTATWTPDDTAYTVKHFQQNLDGNYPTDPTDTETLNGTTGEPTAAAAKTYEGFTAQSFEQITIMADGSTVVEIKYDRNKYDVSYIYGNDGASPEGDAYAEPTGEKQQKFETSLSRKDFESNTVSGTNNGVPGTWTFSGWTTEDVTVNDGGSYTMPAKNVTFRGQWTFEATTYTVKFVDEDGETVLLDEKTYAAGTSANAIVKPENPTKEATDEYTYEFAGWTPEVSDVNKDVVYKATYNAIKKQYNVTFVDEDGTTVLKEAVFYDYGTEASAIEQPATPTKTATAEYTYTFAGWDPTVDTVTKDVTYKATYTETKNKYTVTFVDEDGTTVLKEAAFYDYGTEASAIEQPATPTKQSDAQYTYTFAGWKPEVSSVTENATYTAMYTSTVRTYKISWVDGDGNTLKTEELTYGEMPSYTGDTPTKAAPDGKTYTFNNTWSPEIVAVTGAATYTAQFDESTNTYTITWKMDDGSTIDTTTVTHGDAPTHADPIKAADGTNTYTFAGWTPEVMAATGDATYTATFTPTLIPTYTITFVNEDGTELQKVTVKEGETPAYTGTTPTKDEDNENTYTFNGWTPALVPATGDKTYTATYRATGKTNYNLVDPVLPVETEPSKPTTVTITWLNYDGTLIEKTTVAYNSTPSHDAPALTPSAEGKTYTFKGWSPSILAATADVAYTAQFTETDDESGDSTDTTVPNPVTPEDTDTDPTNHEDLPSVTTKGHTYEIYQIFTGDYAELDGKDVLSNIVWGVNGKDHDDTVATGDPVDQEILNALNEVVDASLDRTKLDEIENYVKVKGEPYKTITLGENDTQNSIPLPPGYYLIRDKADSQTGNPDAYTTYITVVIKDYTIQPKSVIPTVDKQVWDNADGSNGEGWAETADHAINERFQFALIGTIPQNEHLKDYTKGYIVTFTDTMSAGVTFESIASVTVNGQPVQAGEVAAGGYVVNGVKAGEAGKTWTIKMNVNKILGNAFGTGSEDISVVVTYNAHLNENAIVHKKSDDGISADNTNKNTVYLEYSNNPNTSYDTDMGKTQEDSVWVFTYEVDNIKKADSENGSPLAGAGFTLYNGQNAVKLIQKGTDYYVADQAKTEGVVTEMRTDNTGIFNVKGLDAGTYVLKETTVPAGYNALGDTAITISASHEENETGTGAKLNLTGTNMNNTIVNQSGSTLPSTGGMGTTLFYIIGMILIMGAGIVLISRQKMSEN